jgi:hypothetical protein
MNRLILAILFAGIAAAQAGPVTTPEEALRSRVKEFTQALLKEDYDTAGRCVNPDMLDLAGEDKVKEKLREVVTFMKTAAKAFGRKFSGFTIRRLTIEKDKTNAVAVVHYYTGEGGGQANRRDFPTTQEWVLKDKTWYWTK